MIPWPQHALRQQRYNMHVPKPVDPGELTTIVANVAGALLVDLVSRRPRARRCSRPLSYVWPAAHAGPSGVVCPIRPRLMDLESAARDLGVSSGTVLDLEGTGVLPRVPAEAAVRYLEDLDRLVALWKACRSREAVLGT